MTDPGQIRQLSSREVYRTNWLSIREDEVEFPDGTPGIYSVLDKDDFALIIPRENDGFWLVQQYRYPVQMRTWEFPQGGWPGHGSQGTQTELAAHELREETGLRADKFVHLGRLHSAHSFCSQGFDVFLATGLTPGDPDRESSESDMVAGFFAEDEFRHMVRTGGIVDTHTIAALTLLDASSTSGGGA